MAGFSDPIEIPPEKFSARESEKFTESSVIRMTVMGKSAELSAPRLSDQNTNYAVNPFQHFAFDKMNYPQYGVTDVKLKNGDGSNINPIARYTGVPYSADFIKDYHLISLFRLADKLTTPSYSGKVKEQFETPSPET